MLALQNASFQIWYHVIGAGLGNFRGGSSKVDEGSWIPWGLMRAHEGSSSGMQAGLMSPRCQTMRAHWFRWGLIATSKRGLIEPSLSPRWALIYFRWVPRRGTAKSPCGKVEENSHPPGSFGKFPRKYPRKFSRKFPKVGNSQALKKN